MMKKFEVGTYKAYTGTFEFSYTVEKVTAKTVTITIHKGEKYEKTKRCKVVDCGNTQYCELNGLYLESDDNKIA